MGLPNLISRTELSNNDVDVDDDNPDRAWCSCGRPFGTDGFMIKCDGHSENCCQWYHGHCVGITIAVEYLMFIMDYFICPTCTTSSDVRNLPSFNLSTLTTFEWCGSPSPAVLELLDQPYFQVVHWKPNLFTVPSGNLGKSFVSELASLLHSFSDQSALEPFALKAAMLIPNLLLQKPHNESKLSFQVVRSCLQRQLDLWLKGDFLALFNEVIVIQKHISASHRYHPSCDDQPHSSRLSHLMTQGHVNAALCCLFPSCDCGPLNLDHLESSLSDGSPKTVFDVLREKHPYGCAADPDAILDPIYSSQLFHPVLLDGLDAALIKSVVLQISGSAGTSGLIAHAWRHLCTAFGDASNDLCADISAFAHCISTFYINPKCLSAYCACHLIPLDKHPGVRLIGVEEVVQRIIGKAVMTIIGCDLQQAAGSSQLCAGQMGGCEAAAHAMKQIFDLPEVDGVLLVNAKNAFNELNHQVTLQNV